MLINNQKCHSDLKRILLYTGTGMTQLKKPWRKILYEYQDYPDNYTSSSFLEDLKKNIYKREVTFKEAFLGASLVTEELCLVIFFILSYFYMYNEWYYAEDVFIFTSFLALLGYAVYIYLESFSLRLFKDVIIYLILGYILAPVLQTLTATISTDTTYAMTVLMMLVHLVFFDYGVKVLIVSSSLSINAATFGSLCLASRLSTPFHAFVLLTTAVECFVLCPILLSKIGNTITKLIIMCFFCIFGLYYISMKLTLLYIAFVIFINFICPFLFVRWHTYKDNIYGPWDEAVVTD